MEEPFAKRPRVEGPGASGGVPAEEVITFHLLNKNAAGQVRSVEGRAAGVVRPAVFGPSI